MTTQAIRKSEVTKTVNTLLQQQARNSFVRAGHLNRAELKEAIRLGTPHRIKVEKLPVIGICLTFA